MKSMTGFGKATYADDQFEIEVEVKSLNHRFLDMRVMHLRYIKYHLRPCKPDCVDCYNQTSKQNDMQTECNAIKAIGRTDGSSA